MYTESSGNINGYAQNNLTVYYIPIIMKINIQIFHYYRICRCIALHYVKIII